MIKYDIKSIPHGEQRYETCGDWFNKGDTTKIRVSALSDWRYEFLVAVHELIEDALCRYAGIKEDDVSAFDMEFEEDREDDNHDEPGDDPNAPYWFEHQVTTGIERTLAALLDVNWKKYEQEINNL